MWLGFSGEVFSTFTDTLLVVGCVLVADHIFHTEQREAHSTAQEIGLSRRANRRKVPFVQFSIHEENRSQDARRHSQGKAGEQCKERQEEVQDLHLLSARTESCLISSL